MSLEKAAKTAIETCMGVRQGEDVVIVSDGRTLNIGKELRKAALDATNGVRFFNLDIYGKRPLDYFPNAIDKAAKNADVTFWTAHSYEGELETTRRPFIEAAMIGGRHAHMVDITEKVMEDALAVDYKVLDEFTHKLTDKLKGTNEIKVTNPQGTDIKVSFNERWKWVPSTGICKLPGHWHNLPGSEVYTAPRRMEGKIVVDGILGEYFSNMFSHSDLQKTPLTVKVENKERPKCVDLKCENEDILEEVQKYLSLHDCSSYVGEFGMGTNVFLKEISGNTLQDEKFPGVHIAFGDPMASETDADWSCPQHLDMILTKCNVWLDGEKVMEKGEYLLDY
ncbi:MAG: aminopeptidase [Candidatus Saliniplasma sp.]